MRKRASRRMRKSSALPRQKQELMVRTFRRARRKFSHLQARAIMATDLDGVWRGVTPKRNQAGLEELEWIPPKKKHWAKGCESCRLPSTIGLATGTTRTAGFDEHHSKMVERAHVRPLINEYLMTNYSPQASR